MVEYKVQFEVFEGPLDLLLYLVKKEEVDIYQVSLTKLASQFIEYVEVMRELDLDIAGEFLVMAANLMYIKSRELLPVDRQASGEAGDEDQDDPRWELIRKLVEYKKFKDAAARLQELEGDRDRVYQRLPAKPEADRPAVRTEATVFDLVAAVTLILKRVQERGETRDIVEDRWTVSEKLEFVRQMLVSRDRFTFAELFGTTTSRSEIVVTFLALLELIRLRVVLATQEEPFGEIEIGPAPVGTTRPPGSDGNGEPPAPEWASATPVFPAVDAANAPDAPPNP